MDLSEQLVGEMEVISQANKVANVDDDTPEETLHVERQEMLELNSVRQAR